MSPVLTSVYDDAITPYFEEQISFETAVAAAEAPVRTFMLNQTRESDIGMFLEIADNTEVTEPADVPFLTLVPAFITSELKSAFSIGFLNLYPIRDYRSSRRQCTDVHGHDDALANDDFDAV